MDSTKLKLQSFDISDTTKRLIELSRKRIESDLLTSQVAVEAVAIEKLFEDKGDNYKDEQTKISEQDNPRDNQDMKDMQDSKQVDLKNIDASKSASIEKEESLKEQQQSNGEGGESKIADVLKNDHSPSLRDVHKIIDANSSGDEKFKVSALNVQTPFSDTLIQNLEARININENNEIVSSYMANKDIFSRFVQFKIQKTLANNKTFKEGSMCYQGEEESDSSDTNIGNFGESKNVDSQYSTILASLLTSRYYDETNGDQNGKNGRAKSVTENEKYIPELPAYRRFKVLIEMKKKQSEKSNAEFEEEVKPSGTGKITKEKEIGKKRHASEVDDSKKGKKSKKKATDKSSSDDQNVDQKSDVNIDPQEQSDSDGNAEIGHGPEDKKQIRNSKCEEINKSEADDANQGSSKK